MSVGSWDTSAIYIIVCVCLTSIGSAVSNLINIMDYIYRIHLHWGPWALNPKEGINSMDLYVHLVTVQGNFKRDEG